MQSEMNQRGRVLRLGALSLAAAVAVAGGCKSSGTTSGVTSQPVVLDGSVDEWNGTNIVAADGDDLHVRFQPVELNTLQASNETVAVLFDLDADASTGRVIEGQDNPQIPERKLSELGIDLMVEFSPAALTGGEMESGVRVTGYQPDGTPTELSHEDVDLRFAPTYASRWYEMALGRTAASSAPYPLAERGAARVTIIQTQPNPQGGEPVVTADSEIVRVRLPEGNRVEYGQGASLSVPAAEGDVRVVSLNVLRSRPVANPGPFRAGAPDA